MIKYCFTHQMGWFYHDRDWSCQDTRLDLNRFIEIEVQRQGFTPGTYHFQTRVDWMHEAWNYTRDILVPDIPFPTPDAIKEIGKRVEVEQNMYGFRKVNLEHGKSRVRIGVDWPQVGHTIWNLCEYGQDLAPMAWYKEFEEIHPFQDGNGRTGKILFNWLMGTLDSPEFPPDFFGHGVP